jgi:TetR/AcrR family transcriptional repressor of nem operon
MDASETDRSQTFCFLLLRPSGRIIDGVKKLLAVPARGEATRQRIIERSAPIFNQHGYAGTALSELMQATGLQKGGIYRHFSGKEELAEEAFRFAWANAARRRLEGVSAAAGATEKLRLLVKNFVRGPRTLPGGCPLMNTVVDADDTSPALLSLARQAFREWRGTIVKIIREGQRGGEFRRDVSAVSAATLMIGSLEGALLISRIEGNRTALVSAERQLEAWIRTLAPGVSLKSGLSLKNAARRTVRAKRK